MPFRARHDPELEPHAIRAARQLIHPAFRNSPQFVHEGLSDLAGIDVVLKVETVNPIRAFKGRGTWLAIAGLAGEGTIDRKSTRLNSSHIQKSRMPSSA